jgi:hypothetical protein
MMLNFYSCLVVFVLTVTLAESQSADEQQAVRRRVYGETDGFLNVNVQQLDTLHDKLSLNVEADEELLRLLKVDRSFPPVSAEN